MRTEILPLTEALLPAARAFNARLKGFAPFFLPESISPFASGAERAISTTQFVLVDGREVRGGFLLVEYPGWINGRLQKINNIQSPISESIIDRKYGLLSVHMLKFIERLGPYAFAVGGGGAENPWPRLLASSGWKLRLVPFFFHVCRPARFLCEMRIFQGSPMRKAAARVGSLSGIGWLGARLLQARPIAGMRSRDLSAESVTGWGAWADEIWDAFRTECSFAVVRNSATLPQLYPVGSPRFAAVVVRRGSTPVGWATWLNTPMTDDRYFGNLRVATILDCVAMPDCADSVARTVVRWISRDPSRRPDLIITNQSQAAWRRAFRRAGFLSGPSNFPVITSRQMTAAIEPAGGEEKMHLTRGDGDGRVHL